MNTIETTPADTPPEPRTAQQERSGQVGQADPLPNPPEATDGHTGPPGNDPPDLPPTGHGRGDDRPDRPPFSVRFALWGVFFLLALFAGFLISKAWEKLDRQIWGIP